MDKDPNKQITDEEALELTFLDITQPEDPREKQPKYRKGAAPGRFAAKKAPMSPEKKKTCMIIAICVVAILIVIAAVICAFALMDKPLFVEQVKGHISAAGINLEGLTKEETKSVLHLATDDTYTQKNMVIQILDTQISLTPADTQAALDVDALVEAVFASGDTAGDAVVIDLIPYLNLNTAKIREIIDALEPEYNTALTQTTYELVPRADSQTDPPEQDLVITQGTPEYTLDIDALYNQVLAAYNSNTFLVEAECTVTLPDPFDLEALYETLYVAPVDADMDMETFEVTDDIPGCDFDLELARSLLDTAEYGQTVTVPMNRIEAEVTAESLSGVLFRDELSSFSTKHTNDDNRNTNLKNACKAINGKILMPGDVFSYNGTLGERTAAKGYKPAGAYMGNETVNVIGGGICQVSSTLYYCALMADLEIVSRECHRFAPSYMSLGMDATVNWDNIDFKFRNNTDYPIRIEAEVSGGSVHVRLLGTDDKDYYVKMEYTVVATHQPSTVYQVMRPGNSDGYKDGQVITTPYTGYEVYTYRCKYSKDTDALISRTKEAYSEYSKRDKVVVKIEEPVAPPTEPPTDPTQPPTNPTSPPTDPTQPPTEAPQPPTEGGGGITEEGGG